MYARRAERREGFERGADLIDVFNASGLGFSVLPGRALDIASAHYKGQSLCFRSGPGDVGRPSTSQRDSNGGAAGSAG